jgi:hypothetical protein
MSNQRSLSTLYYDPEAEPVLEPEPTPEPPKRKGRPPGTKNKPKETAPKRSIPWFNVLRAVFWAVVAAVSLVALYRGVEGWLGQSAAYVVLAVSLPIVALLLDLDWKKMRS